MAHVPPLLICLETFLFVQSTDFSGDFLSVTNKIITEFLPQRIETCFLFVTLKFLVIQSVL